jgi:hypothetical protein
MYDNFDQIEMPNPTCLWPDRILMPCSICIAGLPGKQPIIAVSGLCVAPPFQEPMVATNFMMNYELINPALSEKDLDIMSFTMYPVSGGLFRGELGFRMGDPARISFTHDFLGNLGSGIEGPMELQPGLWSASIDIVNRSRATNCMTRQSSNPTGSHSPRRSSICTGD